MSANTYRAALVLACIWMISSVVVADDWPQWHGVNRDGHSEETGWLDKWPPELVWSKSIGNGFSSCAVTNGRLYTIGWTTAGSDSNIVYCLDALNGSEIWAFAYQCPTVSGYSGARATPVVSDNRVYTFSQVGDVHCIDATTGTNIWNTSFSFGQPGWGFASSVLLEGDLAIVNAGYRGTAVNRWTGAFVWGNASAVANQAGSASAKAITWNSQRIILLFTGHGLEGVSASDGARVFWYNRDSSSSFACADPVVYGNTVFISHGREPHWCARLNMVSGAMTHAWGGESSCLETRYNTAVLVGDYVYGFHDGGGFRCVDLRDASVKWSDTSFDIERSSLIYSDGKLIVLDGNGYLHMVKATPNTGSSTHCDTEGRSAYNTGLGSDCWITPALANGLLYCRDYAGNIRCLRLQGAPTSNDGDSMPDTWEQEHFTNNTAVLPDGDEDGDGCLNEEEYIAGTDPTNAASRFEVTIAVSNGSICVSAPTVAPHGIGYDESATRRYDLFCRTNLLTSGDWQEIPTCTNVPGNGAALQYTAPGERSREMYRLRTRLE